MKSWIKVVFFLFGFLIGCAAALMISATGDPLTYISLAIGFLVPIGIFIYKEFIIARSSLTVEINSIERRTIKDSQIDLRKYEAFNKPLLQENSVLFENLTMSHYFFQPYSQDSFYTQTNAFNSPNNFIVQNKGSSYSESFVPLIAVGRLEDFFNDLRKLIDRTLRRSEQLKEANNRLLSTKSKRLTKEEYDNLVSRYSIFGNYNYPNNLVYEVHEADELDQEEGYYSEFEKSLRTEMEKCEKLKRILQPPFFNIQDAKEAIDKIEKELYENSSQFLVSVSLINSGRMSVSIKNPAVFGIYIMNGLHRTFEVSLSTEDRSFGNPARNYFEASNPDIPPRSTKVIMFESSRVSQMSDKVREKVIDSWGKSNRCALFLEDIHGKVHRSNSVIFASGANQEKVVGKLIQAAASCEKDILYIR